MRLLLLLFSILFISNFQAQDLAEKLVGSWEVKQIDTKVFTTGVITYFDFTEKKEIFSKSINGENHGVISKEKFIGTYYIEEEKAVYKTDESTFIITLKEINQLIIKELKTKNNKSTLYRTSYLTRKD